MRKKDSIVIINSVPLTSVQSDMINIKEYKNAGYRVIYLDLSEYYYPKTYKKYNSDNPDYIINNHRVLKCKYKKDIFKYINKEYKRSWFFITYRSTSFSYRDIWLLRVFKKYQVKYYIFEPGSICFPPKLNILKFINFNFQLNSFSFNFIYKIAQKMFNIICNTLVYNSIFLQTPQYAFFTGNYLQTIGINKFKHSKIISIPSYDYEIYCDTINFIKQNPYNFRYPEEYIVYIEQGILNSPDAKLLGFDTIDRNIFLNKINQFFDRLEKLTSKQVIIAGSPKIKHEGHEYNGRKIIYNKTAEIIYFSDIAVGHTSTAINYAILMHKPLLILTFMEFPAKDKRTIESFPNALDKKTIEASEVLNINKISKLSCVSKKKYDKYIYNYLNTKTLNKTSTEIIINTLKNDKINK